ncbi:MAG TPA: ATP-binding cassette domain-containing protein [Jiangellaceae bacterium]
MSTDQSVDGYAIRTENIAKNFEAVVALEDVSIELQRGEVLGLIGDNGAGKSTLIKILTGFHRPDSGRIFINGEQVTPRSPSHARSLGIETVYQDLALVNELPVYMNMFLNKELRRGRLPLLNKRKMKQMAREHLDDMGVQLSSVGTEVTFLSGGQRQAIAVARAVYSDASIFLLDEPLAAMGAKESAIILNLIRDLKRKGDVSMMLIAHNYTQVVDVCDRVCLLQHGQITYNKPVGETSVQELTELVAAEYRLGNNGNASGK